MKTVIITGASTGIGHAAALHMAEQGWQVFAGVRKPEDADMLRTAHSAIRPLILDVTQSDHITAARDEIAAALGNQRLAGLVNNAGIAGMAPLPIQEMSDIRAHFDVNIFGLIEMTQALLPLLGTDDAREGAPGRIVNISSVGGLYTGPYLGAYSATKHALESVTSSFRRELMMYGVDAISICPGAIKTAIWDKAQVPLKDGRFANTVWGKSFTAFTKRFVEAGDKGWPASRVAEVIETALTDTKPKARYTPVPQRFINLTLPTRLPARLLDRGMARNLGLAERGEALDEEPAPHTPETTQ